MDSIEVNKAIAAVLVAGIVFFVSGSIGMNLVEEKALEHSAIKIDLPAAGAPAGQPAPEQLAPIAALLARPIPRSLDASPVIRLPKAARPD